MTAREPVIRKAPAGGLSPFSWRAPCWASLFLAALLAIPRSGAGEAAQTVAKAKPLAMLTIDGIIDPVLARYVARGYAEAERIGAQCVLLQISTPGGLESSMREIVQTILNSPLVSIGYVYPQGARAASAGAFILLACHLTAMAPGTTMGAAHPVGAQGKDIEGAMKEKVTNDTAAFMRSLAKRRGRDIAWAEEAVTKSLSVNEGEALEKKLIDAVAEDIDDLLKRFDGLPSPDAGTPGKLSLVGAPWHVVKLSWRERFLHVLAHPELAYILLSLGTLGLIFELQSPHGVTGVIGAICLILALISLSIIPFNTGGLLLMVLGVGLFLADLKLGTQGGLSLLGIISLLFGSLMLFSPIEPFWHVSRTVILTMVGIMACFFGTLVWLGLKAQRSRAASGSEILLGAEGETITAMNPAGQIHVQGENWSATLVGTTRSLKKGKRIVVKSADGLTLGVEPAASPRRNRK